MSKQFCRACGRRLVSRLAGWYDPTTGLPECVDVCPSWWCKNIDWVLPIVTLLGIIGVIVGVFLFAIFII